MVMAVVVLGNAVGLAANVASAVQFQRAADASSTASMYFAANNTQDGRQYFLSSRAEVQHANSILSVQLFSEVAVLLLVVAAFVVAGVCSWRRIRAVVFRSIRHGIEAAIATEESGRRHKLQMLGTITFVFAAFVVRSVLSTMRAIASYLQDGAKHCPGVSSAGCDATCYNVYTHIWIWMVYTPEFQVTVVLVASPLALLVALWGVTSRQTRQLMKLKKLEMARDLLGSMTRCE